MSHDCVNCSNACCSHALWFTASRVIVTSSHVPKSKHISHRNILAAYQNPLKDSCRVYDGVSRLLASGFKEAPQNKGRWRMTWPSSAVWNHSQVTCVFVHPLHLEVLENGVDSTQRCKEPSYRPPCHSRCVLSSFFFFFRSAVVVMISTLTEGLRMITACCCLGTKWQCLFLFFCIWRIFHGNRPRWLWAEIILRCYWQLLDRRLLSGLTSRFLHLPPYVHIAK